MTAVDGLIGVVDVDDIREAPPSKFTFVADQEKASINGVTTEQIAETLRMLLRGTTVGVIRSDTERNPLRIELRLPVERRTAAAELARVQIANARGEMTSLAELGRWETSRVDQTIYHKNLQRVAYVFAETAGRPPADVVVDVLADRSYGPLPDADPGTDFGPGSLTASGYPRIVKEWKRGMPLGSARQVFEGKPEDVSVDVSVVHDHGRTYELKPERVPVTK